MVSWIRVERILAEQKRILKEMATMTTTTTLKTQKKAASNPIVSTPTSSSQKSIDEMLTVERVSSTPLIQTMNKTLIMVQETMIKLQETMTLNHKETNMNIQKLDERMEVIQEAMNQNVKKIQQIETKTENTEKKVENMDLKFTIMKKEMEDSIVHLEMERAAFYLRFQNIVETRDEDLGELMAGIVAEVLRKDMKDAISEIDEIYRVQTSYARRHNHPREVHVRFARKKTRDQIYMITREETIKYKGKEIIILKQIPRKVREQRKEYKFLTNLLNKRNIPFRWLIPEGLLTTWEGKRIRIENVEKATEIFEQMGGREEKLQWIERQEQGTQEESQEELEVEEERIEERNKEKERQSEQTGVRTRARKANKTDQTN